MPWGTYSSGMHLRTVRSPYGYVIIDPNSIYFTQDWVSNFITEGVIVKEGLTGIKFFIFYLHSLLF